MGHGAGLQEAEAGGVGVPLDEVAAGGAGAPAHLRVGVEWHMRERPAPLLFVDLDNAERAHGPVGPAQR